MSQEEDLPILAALEKVIDRALPPEIQRYCKRLQLFELKVAFGLEATDPGLDPTLFDIDNIGAMLDKEVIPMKTCTNHSVLPLRKTDSILVVGMVDPNSYLALDEITTLASKQSLTVQRRVIAKQDFQQVIDRIRDAQTSKSKTEASAGLSEEALMVGDDVFGEDLTDAEQGEDLSTSATNENSAPVIALVDKILAKALKEGASDIHIEPQEKELRVRFRKDGLMREQFFLSDNKRLPKNIVNAVVSRFKIISNLNIAEKRVPQDGKL
ncbi:MAG TPA: general secretion pathway protein GspE, partial [Cyanobacteria bacterium UBA8156]|nr:general secretion pathway protein GspE [Cyanobacteria bacterium UBA8156]